MEHLFVDTSGWIAYINSKDPDHANVRSSIHRFEGRLITSNFIFDETVTFCRYRLGYSIAARVGDVLLNTPILNLVRLTSEDERQAWRLFVERGDKLYSFTDCTSFVLMGRLNLRCALTLDADFEREGFENRPVR